MNAKDYIRFYSKVRIDIISGCHEWVGSIMSDGYGTFRSNGIVWLAHRYIFKEYFGYLPDNGTEVGHICNNRKCVNPYHLIECTHSENMQYAWDCNRYTDRHNELNSNSKLSYGIADAVRKLYSSGCSQNSIAKKFSISQSTVSKIVRNERWIRGER